MKWILPLVLVVALAGCHDPNDPKPLDAQAFYAPPPPGGVTVQPMLQPGSDAGRINLLPSAEITPDAVPAIAPLVAETVLPAGTGTAPASTQSLGTFMTVGGVVCTVNDTPIYAHKVLQLVAGELQAKARNPDMDEERFRSFAGDQVNKATSELIRDEVDFAAAQRNLESDDKKLADVLTTRWRTEKITEAGGSIELARRKAEEGNYHFDELVERQYRTFMRQIFYTKRIYPRARPSADEMREYYDRNKDALFTEHDEARFRLIKITTRLTGSKEAALDKIKTIRDRAVAGEDFATLAQSFNQDKFLADKSGDLGWMKRGSYVIEKVDEAVFKLQVGQVSDIVEVGGDFYVARLEERKLGRVRPFDEEAVQERCYSDLQKSQFGKQRELASKKLRDSAIIYPDPPLVDTVVDMVMQLYPKWKAVPRLVAPLPTGK